MKRLSLFFLICLFCTVAVAEESKYMEADFEGNVSVHATIRTPEPLYNEYPIAKVIPFPWNEQTILKNFALTDQHERVVHENGIELQFGNSRIWYTLSDGFFSYVRDHTDERYEYSSIFQADEHITLDFSSREDTLAEVDDFLLKVGLYMGEGWTREIKLYAVDKTSAEKTRREMTDMGEGYTPTSSAPWDAFYVY